MVALTWVDIGQLKTHTLAAYLATANPCGIRFILIKIILPTDSCDVCANISQGYPVENSCTIYFSKGFLFIYDVFLVNYVLPLYLQRKHLVFSIRDPNT